jgi:hypothetical protein
VLLKHIDEIRIQTAQRLLQTKAHILRATVVKINLVAMTT